jgi:hypothetical protein
MEVLAPTLSRIPLVVSPPSFINQKYVKRCNQHQADIEIFDVDGNKQDIDERRAVWKATSQFLGREINFDNVSHAVIPIRSTRMKRKSHYEPVMKVSIVVAGPDDDLDQNDLEIQSCDEEYNIEAEKISSDDFGESNSCRNINPSASMQLVRMINNIPMLDTSEACACGLVQSVASSKRMWNTFGLEVNSIPTKGNVSNAPTYSVRDSDQIAPFFSSRSHSLLVSGYNGNEDQRKEISDKSRSDTASCRIHTVLLPAAQRLGNILIIAQIQAEPSILPLPTLSKVRRSCVLLTKEIMSSLILNCCCWTGAASC